jgi:hypothetical protein
MNSGPILNGTYIYFNMRFEGGASIPWKWDNTTLSWLSFADRSGTGDDLGPSLDYIGGYISGSQQIDCSAGGAYGYPLYIQVQGFN